MDRRRWNYMYRISLCKVALQFPEIVITIGQELEKISCKRAGHWAEVGTNLGKSDYGSRGRRSCESGRRTPWAWEKKIRQGFWSGWSWEFVHKLRRGSRGESSGGLLGINPWPNSRSQFFFSVIPVAEKSLGFGEGGTNILFSVQIRRPKFFTVSLVS